MMTQLIKGLYESGPKLFFVLRTLKFRKSCNEYWAPGGRNQRSHLLQGIFFRECVYVLGNYLRRLNSSYSPLKIGICCEILKQSSDKDCRDRCSSRNPR